MSWTLSSQVEQYAEAVASLLRTDPVRHTVSLSVVAALRSGRRFSSIPPLFGWWSGPHEASVTGAFSHTPPYPLLLAALPDDAAATALARELAARRYPHTGVSGPRAAATAYATSWEQVTGVAARLSGERRLYRLEKLCPPETEIDEFARSPLPAERDLLVEWWRAFGTETGAISSDAAADVDDRLGFGGILIWEAFRRPVAVAASSRMSAGMVRIGPVFTPPEHRRHGYAAAVTAAASRAGVEAGAQEVCLFTDLANAATNRLYPRLGYQAVDDVVELQLSEDR